MAKSSGLGFAIAVDDSGGTARTITNDVTNHTQATPRAVQDITGEDKSAIERLLLLADMSVSLNGVFNAASNLSHDVFKTVPSSSVARTTTLTVATKVLAAELLYSSYDRSPGRPRATSRMGPLPRGVRVSIPSWA
jgi:hypothetical protein